MLYVVAIIFIGCGVDTSSSTSSNNIINQEQNVNTNQETGTGVNPGGNNQQNPDTNVSVDINNSANAIENSMFDTTNAVYDSSACNANIYRVASDASYGGSKSGENGSGLFQATDSSGNTQGLWIGSEHLEAEPDKRKKTWVILYYKSFPDPSSLNTQGETSYTMDGVFQLSYDIAWSDKSINGIDNKVYVQSANGEKPSCYRIYLDKEIGSQLEVTKVYR